MDQRVAHYDEKMQKAIDFLVSDFATIRAGRANPQYVSIITEHRPRFSRLAMLRFRSLV